MTVEFQRKKLIEVCKLINGRAYSKPELLAEGKYPVLRVGNFFTNDHWYYSDLELDEDKYCNKGDLLYAWSASFGPRIWHAEKVIYHYHIWKVVPDLTLIDKKFLFYFFEWDADQIKKDQGAGTTMVHVSKGSMENREINLPRLNDQARIVTLLDEAFADIATAKANAEKNLQNARGLFASRMQTLFDEDQSWERVQLEELLSRGWIESHLDGNHGSDYPRKEEFVESGVPYIAARALRGWEVDFSEAKYLSHERASTIRKGLAQDGDVLFAHNATVGPVGILKTNEPFVILGTSLTYYRCNEKFIQPEYLAHYMRSPAFVDQYSQVMKQSTRNQVPITKQREFFHVIPPLSIQQKIANDLDSLSEKIELLESIYRQKLTSLDDLKKSLLHQAFSGQL
jgi:type I restriction enzyme S subunit